MQLFTDTPEKHIHHYEVLAKLMFDRYLIIFGNINGYYFNLPH